jgi:hypothetical protein
MKVKQTESAPEVEQPDEFHGQGGEYIVEGGKRRLVQRTQPPAPVAPSTETKE